MELLNGTHWVSPLFLAVEELEKVEFSSRPLELYTQYILISYNADNMVLPGHVRVEFISYTAYGGSG